MPEIAAFVADLKAVVGEKEIDEAIRRGKAEEPKFYACENGHALGTTTPAQTNIPPFDRAVRDRHFCPGCDGSCAGAATSFGA